jgi:hypothetical protein
MQAKAWTVTKPFGLGAGHLQFSTPVMQNVNIL